MNRKGLSYSLEVIISALILISFTYGIFEVPEGTDWSQHRSDIEAKDITDTMQKSGIATSLVSRGETGSLQTAITTVSDSDKEVTGSITNIPIGEVEIGFHTVEQDQHEVDLEEVESGDECSGDLEDDISTEQDILRTEEMGVEGEDYGLRLYVADTDSQFDESVDYNTVWVDNGTDCQFTSEDGPFYLEDNFKWGDSETGAPRDYFQVKDISENQLSLYQTTLPSLVTNRMGQEVNSLEPDVELDAIDIEDEEMEQDIMVFRNSDAIGDIETNREEVEDYMQDKPVIMMMNLNQPEFEGSSFLQDTGFHWVDEGYEDGYSGGETGIQFSDSERSRNIETFFEGMDGRQSDVQLTPAGHIVSNRSETLTEQNPALQGENELNADEGWSEKVDNMNEADDSEPKPHCNPQYEGEANLPEDNYDILNTEVRGPSGSCPTDAWAVNIELPGSSPPGDGPYLQGQEIVIDRRNYTVITSPEESGCDLGECMLFRFAGNNNVELVNYRESFQGFDGSEIALTGLKNSDDYSDNDLKALGAIMFSAYDSEVRFEGQEEPTSTSTDIVSAVENNTYMPYQLRLRWSD